MSLRNRMKEKILSFTTREDLKELLKKCAKTSNSEDRMIFENMSRYFDLLFEDSVVMNVENDSIVYKDSIFKTYQVVERKSKEKECEFLKFLLELLQLKLDYIANYRRIS